MNNHIEGRLNRLGGFVFFTYADIEQSIPSRFEQIVRKHPGRTALKTRKSELTYDALNRTANRIGRAVLAYLVRADEPVAILLEHGPSPITAIMGVLKAGGMYMAFDPSNPPLRHRTIIEDSGICCLLTNHANLEAARQISEGRCALINIDEIGEGISDENIGLEISPDSLAVVIYTSGSTGRPKGAVHSHRNVLHAVMTFTNACRLCAYDRQPNFFSSSYAYAVQVIFGTLLNGAALYPEDLKDLGILHLAEWLQREKITVLPLLPAVFRRLADALKGKDHGQFPDLRLLVTAAEPATKADVDRWKRFFSDDCIFVVDFGSTETLVISLYFIDMDTEVAEGRLPVGYGVADKKILLMDEDRNEVGPGDIGEIVVESKYLIHSYWRNPDLAEKVLVPVRPGDACRRYFSGDLGRFRPDGSLEHLGRKDGGLIKLRGYNVHVAEIESALMMMEGIKEVVVIPWQRRVPGDMQKGDEGAEAVQDSEDIFLAAYVTYEGMQAPSALRIRAFLEERLPDYMVPAAFVVMDALPLTATGKVDRRSLPYPDMVRSETDEGFTRPRTPHEEALAEIWAQVLKLERVGVDDNFFELGGHSLLAARIISRIRDTFHVELPLKAFFMERPTVAKLAHLLQESGGAKPTLNEPALLQGSRQGGSSLSYAQQRLWVLSQLEPDNPYYNVVQTVRLRGPLNEEFMKRALDMIVSRHEMLRTTIKTDESHPVQVIVPDLSVGLPVVDLCLFPEEGREAEAERLATAEARKPFDFEHGPLVRFMLLKLGSEDHIFAISMHHIITDAWSMGVFNRELSLLYGSFLSEAPVDIPALALRHADFVLHQRQWMTSKAMANQLSYWRERLEGVPSLLPLPADRPRPARQSFRGARLPIELSHSLTGSLKSLGRREGVTLYMVLLAAFQTLLHRYTSQDDIFVGSPIANRNYREMEPLIGFFVNTLVLRTDFTGEPTFRQLLMRVEETALGAYANQDLPFDKLVEELHPERDLSRNPLFQNMLVLQNAPSEELRLPDIVVTPVELDMGTAMFDLALSLTEEGDGLRGHINYSTDLFDAETISRMAGHFRTLLESIVAAPDKPISELAILTETERHKILIEWNDTKEDYPRDKCIHELFEEQVEKTPDAIAVIFEDRQLTYFELNGRANKLAHHLMRQGIGPRALVGVCVERSMEMAVGILGVLKAGGAYVPLDPTYPEERLAFMLEDSGAPFLLTQKKFFTELPQNKTRALCLDRDWDIIDKESPENPPTTASAEDLAYVIYTSGTTGKPKGVMVRHGSVCNYFLWKKKNMPLTAADRLLQKTSLSFDVSVSEFFEPLISGAQLVLARPDAQQDSAYLVDLICEQNITAITFVPSLLKMFLDEPEVDKCGSLRRVNTGGEVMSVALKENFCRHLDADLNYGYGPTESTVGCTYWRCNRGDNALTVPIGRPIANTRIYILDRRLQPVPVGVPGELHIGGACLAVGYLNRPDLTAEKFIPDPFSAEPGERLYKTGDFARYLPDGNIQFLGRFDHQVKVRGFRIELGEIESALCRHDAVRSVAAAVREDGNGDRRLVAYVVLKQDVTLKDLRDYLRNKLPNYMIPSTFVYCDSLPLTPNGKVDRDRLPAIDPTYLEREKPFTLPRTRTEQMIAEIWCEVLGLDRVSVYDSFFALGGHSLLAMQVVSRLQKALGVEIGVRALFENVTIDELAWLIDEGLAEQSRKVGRQDAYGADKQDWGYL